jgi:mono/diheme cytochrome c family protein
VGRMWSACRRHVVVGYAGRVSGSAGRGPGAEHHDTVGMAGVSLGVLGITIVVAVVAIAAWHGGSASAPPTAAPPAVAVAYPKVTPKVAAGAHDFTRFACSQCHGDRGVGGVSPDVPALTQVGPGLSVAQLTNIIEHGLGASSNPTKPYMPVWHGIISKSQISDIVAYLHAGLPRVRDAAPLVVPNDQGSAVAGSVLYVNLGCVNCHGPNGLGGVPNPLSPDKSIPSLATADFRAEFDTPQKIKDVIVSGSVIGRAPIVSMPHWGGILTPQELDSLVAYLGTLR